LNSELSRPEFGISALATILLLASWARWNDSFRLGKTHLDGAFAILRNLGSRRWYLAPKSSSDDPFSYLFLTVTSLRTDALSDLVQSTISEEKPRSYEDFPLSLPKLMPYRQIPRPFSDVLDPWICYSLKFVQSIYDAAKLCYEVRMAAITTSDIITKAEALKREVERYSHDKIYLSTISGHLSALDQQYLVHTVEAYRYATLLFLHQVMPDIFGMTSSQYLARATVSHLSHSPPSCLVTFAQIYPLFVAGCEASTKQEREWVKERWAAMAARMRVTNVSNCWKITQEVWGRRDAYRQLRSENAEGVVDSIDDVDPEFSVKGRLHWAAVMKDWDCVVSF
jgi:hypothetical protein